MPSPEIELEDSLKPQSEVTGPVDMAEELIRGKLEPDDFVNKVTKQVIEQANPDADSLNPNEVRQEVKAWADRLSKIGSTVVIRESPKGPSEPITLDKFIENQSNTDVQSDQKKADRSNRTEDETDNFQNPSTRMHRVSRSEIKQREKNYERKQKADKQKPLSPSYRAEVPANIEKRIETRVQKGQIEPKSHEIIDEFGNHVTVFEEPEHQREIIDPQKAREEGFPEGIDISPRRKKRQRIDDIFSKDIEINRRFPKKSKQTRFPSNIPPDEDVKPVWKEVHGRQILINAQQLSNDEQRRLLQEGRYAPVDYAEQRALELRQQNMPWDHAWSTAVQMTRRQLADAAMTKQRDLPLEVLTDREKQALQWDDPEYVSPTPDSIEGKTVFSYQLSSKSQEPLTLQDIQDTRDQLNDQYTHGQISSQELEDHIKSLDTQQHTVEEHAQRYENLRQQVREEFDALPETKDTKEIERRRIERETRLSALDREEVWGKEYKDPHVDTLEDSLKSPLSPVDLTDFVVHSMTKSPQDIINEMALTKDLKKREELYQQFLKSDNEITEDDLKLLRKGDIKSIEKFRKRHQKDTGKFVTYTNDEGVKVTEWKPDKKPGYTERSNEEKFLYKAKKNIFYGFQKEMGRQIGNMMELDLLHQEMLQRFDEIKKMIPVEKRRGIYNDKVEKFVKPGLVAVGLSGEALNVIANGLRSACVETDGWKWKIVAAIPDDALRAMMAVSIRKAANDTKRHMAKKYGVEDPIQVTPIIKRPLSELHSPAYYISQRNFNSDRERTGASSDLRGLSRDDAIEYITRYVDPARQKGALKALERVPVEQNIGITIGEDGKVMVKGQKPRDYGPRDGTNYQRNSESQERVDIVPLTSGLSKDEAFNLIVEKVPRERQDIARSLLARIPSRQLISLRVSPSGFVTVSGYDPESIDQREQKSDVENTIHIGRFNGQVLNEKIETKDIPKNNTEDSTAETAILSVGKADHRVKKKI
jgi:hypothetical protein